MTIRIDDLDTLDLDAVCEPGAALPPVTPGDILREEFMKPLGLSARALARDLGIPPNRVTGIVHGRRAVTAQTAILLSRRLGTSPQFWMNLQTNHDLRRAREAMGHAA
ncbi:HigA family addiction module antitoxin [Methylobacterium trifolii]|uniref:HTH cro/C1-type domain-containing protein n=1 Tax=Methylobacterium trifolii TaxID=1003092 RepID=A0ABQ4U1Y8_9HYPH|nr:HigA family addiction module antitoxin [Methylobacterium trifolii]GJE61471.1 hypothetical protein MPOCJGCO_3593 [Methylobacterium trifolii]